VLDMSTIEGGQARAVRGGVAVPELVTSLMLAMVPAILRSERPPIRIRRRISARKALLFYVVRNTRRRPPR